MLDFLKNISVDNAEGRARRAGGGAGKNPTGMAIRIFWTGAVFPSPDLASSLGLEYADKDAEQKGNGLDVIDSNHWAQVKDLPKPMLFVAAVPRSEGKCELFQQVGYDKSGKPVSSVLNQGSTTAGGQLLPILKEVYGIELTKDGKNFVDLIVITDSPIPAPPNGIYNVPKVMARGPKKGERTYVRREHLTVFPLVPSDWLKEEETATENAGAELVAH